MMKGMAVVSAMVVLILCVATPPVLCGHHSDAVHHSLAKAKKTHLHFFLHDTISGHTPSSVLVARANLTKGSTNPTPFGTVFVFDDPLTEGPDPNSKVIGNARGIYVSASQDAEVLTLLVSADYGFTSGEWKGSSVSVFSRLPLTKEEAVHELAVVGGRGKFRLGRGFAELRPHYFNATSGDAVTEYNVTVYHYD